jgi:hypothetical protein
VARHSGCGTQYRLYAVPFRTQAYSEAMVLVLMRYRKSRTGLLRLAIDAAMIRPTQPSVAKPSKKDKRRLKLVP